MKTVKSELKKEEEKKNPKHDTRLLIGLITSGIFSSFVSRLNQRGMREKEKLVDGEIIPSTRLCIQCGGGGGSRAVCVSTAACACQNSGERDSILSSLLFLFLSHRHLMISLSSIFSPIKITSADNKSSNHANWELSSSWPRTRTNSRCARRFADDHLSSAEQSQPSTHVSSSCFFAEIRFHASVCLWLSISMSSSLSLFLFFLSLSLSFVLSVQKRRSSGEHSSVLCLGNTSRRKNSSLIILSTTDSFLFHQFRHRERERRIMQTMAKPAA